MFTIDVLFVSISILLFSIIVVVLFARKNVNYFNKNKKHGRAKIVGYTSESTAHYTEFYVKILDVDDKLDGNLKGSYNVRKFNGEWDETKPVFKIGDEVEVDYAIKRVLGIKFLDIHLDSEKYKITNSK